MKMDSLISPALGAVTGLVGNIANVYMQNQTNADNRRLAEQNNQWNVQQWNRANEYNKPVNQMQRLKDAGLNTSLMYGSPTNVAISSPQVDTQNKAVAPRVNMDNLASNVQQMMLAKQLTEAQIANTNEQTKSIAIDNQKKATEQPYYETNASNQSQLLGKQVETAQANINLIKENRQSVYQANEMMRENWLELSDTIQQKYKLSQSEAEKAATQAGILVKELLQMDDRFTIFKDLSKQQIDEATYSNKILGIDANNYEKLMGKADDTNALGPIMFIVKALLSGISKVK